MNAPKLNAQQQRRLFRLLRQLRPRLMEKFFRQEIQLAVYLWAPPAKCRFFNGSDKHMFHIMYVENGWLKGLFTWDKEVSIGVPYRRNQKVIDLMSQLSSEITWPSETIYLTQTLTTPSYHELANLLSRR